jgi:hypothetical protein
MNYILLHNGVMVKKLASESAGIGGIMIPKGNKVVEGIVVAVGPGRRNNVCLTFILVLLKSFLTNDDTMNVIATFWLKLSAEKYSM